MSDDPAKQSTSQVYLLYGICFALVLCIGSSLQALSLTIGLLVTLVLLILLPAIVFIRIKRVGIGAGLRLHRVRSSVALASCLLGMGTWGLGATIARGLSDAGLKSFGQGLDGNFDSPISFVAMVIVGALGPGICEEAMFRGAIQGVLERKSKWFAVIATASLFGLLHMMVGVAIPAAIMGLFYGWAVMRTGSIVPAMIAHFVNNATAFSVVYFFGAAEPSWLVPCLLVFGAVGLGSILRFSRDDQATIQPSPLTRVPAGLPIWAIVAFVAPLLLLMAITVSGLSSLPYFVSIEKLSGKQIVYANRGTALYDFLSPRSGSKVAYSIGDEVAIGMLVESNERSATVQGADKVHVEIPIDDLLGILVNQSDTKAASD